MLKKFMIICLAFSFVFIGGIAFAADEEPVAPQEGQTMSPESEQSSGDITPPPDPTDLTTQDPQTVLDEGDELKDKVLEEDGNGQN